MADLLLQNPPAGADSKWPWNLHLLGPSASATLFAYAIAILVLQMQYADSNSADFEVDSDWTITSKTNLSASGPFRYVTIENTGHGDATILSILCWFQAAGQSVPTRLTAAELKACLSGPGGLEEGVDYSLINLTEGSILKQGKVSTFFECRAALVSRFDTLRVLMTYETALRDRYERRFSLLPYEGAAPAPTGVG